MVSAMLQRPSHVSGPSRRLVAAVLAYLLAVQGLIASVGLGMSAAAGELDVAICATVAGRGIEAPPAGDRRHHGDERPQCPFCFVAAQSSGLLATLDGSTAVAVAPPRQASALRYGSGGARCFIRVLFRTNGNPRAPPGFSA